MTKKNIALALLAIGAIGLLFGTDKGKKLRKQMKQKGMDAVDHLKNKMNHVKEEIA